MLPLQSSAAAMQFGTRAGFVWLMLGLVALALCVTVWLRHSRFGAYLQAVRDNEDAARTYILTMLGIKSRSELDTNRDVAESFSE